ncbi:hypothetical protein MPSEU_000725400 [Mayamaea pseudoterrestris]|nr:hypothetical protein MPSEU_000725400 [Mayamaea pseudoterrestris]
MNLNLYERHDSSSSSESSSSWGDFDDDSFCKDSVAGQRPSCPRNPAPSTALSTESTTNGALSSYCKDSALAMHNSDDDESDMESFGKNSLAAKDQPHPPRRHQKTSSSFHGRDGRRERQ